jgi:osmotically-inducible protein OsmY
MIEKTTTVAHLTSADKDRTAPASIRDIPMAAEQRLRESSYFAPRSVLCDFHEGVLVLRGSVPSFHQKQIAQTLVRKVDGVEVVVNRLVVDR